MPRGTIIKALSGFFYVQDEHTQQVYQCKGRGILKKNNVSPLVGDFVTYTPTTHCEGMIEEIEPRKNEFFRPKVANVDQVIQVFTFKRPEWNQRLLDRFIVMAESVHVDSVIVINKADLLTDADRALAENRQKLYESMGYTVLFVSTQEDIGKRELQDVLAGKISMFSGQSGVGKSSLLNYLEPGLQLRTADISDKLGRGKHTTSHVELFSLCSGGFLVDTPGFGQITLNFIEDIQLLASLFREISAAGQQCKYRGCTHLTEDGCHVIQQVEDGQIDRLRYQHYVELVSELKEHSKNKY